MPFALINQTALWPDGSCTANTSWPPSGDTRGLSADEPSLKDVSWSTPPPDAFTEKI